MALGLSHKQTGSLSMQSLVLWVSLKIHVNSCLISSLERV